MYGCLEVGKVKMGTQAVKMYAKVFICTRLAAGAWIKGYGRGHTAAETYARFSGS
jgi:hypothetical protein